MLRDLCQGMTSQAQVHTDHGLVASAALRQGKSPVKRLVRMEPILESSKEDGREIIGG